MNFQPLFRIQTTAFAVLVAIATVAFAGCGGGGGCGHRPRLRELRRWRRRRWWKLRRQPGAKRIAHDGSLCTSGWHSTFGRKSGNGDDLWRGARLRQWMTPSSPNGSNVVNLTANQTVQFRNVRSDKFWRCTHRFISRPLEWILPCRLDRRALNRTRRLRGRRSAPQASARESSTLGRYQLVYNSGASGGMYVFGCFFHYNSNNMRTVVIVM